MERVTGIGGVFFKANDPERLGKTVWSAFSRDTKYFEPSAAPFMLLENKLRRSAPDSSGSPRDS
jgi:hypothetical protein